MALLYDQLRKTNQLPPFVQPPTPMAPDAAQTAYGAPETGAASAAATAAAGRLGAPQSPLLAMLRQRAIEGLNRGGELDPEEIRAAGQSGLASWSRRGLGRSPGAGFSRVLSRIAASNARRREREGFAAGVAGMEDTERKTDIATMGTAAQTAGAGREYAEDIRRFGINREDNLAMNQTDYGMELYTADKNAAAANKAGKRNLLGSVVGGVLGMFKF